MNGKRRVGDAFGEADGASRKRMRCNNSLLPPKYQAKKTWTSLRTTEDLDDLGHVQGHVVRTEKSDDGPIQFVLATNDGPHTSDSVVCVFENCKGDLLRLPRPGALVRVALVKARPEVTSGSLSQIIFNGPVLMEIEQGGEKWLIDTRVIEEDIPIGQCSATGTPTLPRITTANQSLNNAQERSRSASFELQDSSQDIVARRSQQISRSSEVGNAQTKSLGSISPSTHRRNLKLGKNNEYTSLVHLHQVKSDVVNIIAIVSGRKPVKELSGGDQQLTLHLVDESHPDKYDGFNVSLFAPPDHPDWLPDVQLGDSIILRSISARTGKGTGYKDGDKAFSWIAYSLSNDSVFVNNPTVVEGAPFYMEICQEERDYLKRLAEWWSRIETGKEKVNPRAKDALPGTRKGRREHLLLANIRESQFFDCTVELLHNWSDENATTIYVTDYTSNPLFNDPKVSWPCPSGQRTLKITLWDIPHREARGMVVGRFYRIDNVRLKAARNHQGYEGSLGGEEKRITPVFKDAPTLYLEKLLERRDGKRPQPSRTQCPSPGNEGGPVPKHSPCPNATALSLGTTPSNPTTATAPNHTTDTTYDPPAKGLPRAHLRIVSNLVGAPQVVTPIASILKHGKCPALFHVHAKIDEYETNILDNSLGPYCESCNKWLQQDDIDCGTCNNNATHGIRLLLILRDDSGTLSVSLTGLNATLFLGVPANTANLTHPARAQAERTLKTLADKDGPRFHCVVKSTHTPVDARPNCWLRGYALSGISISYETRPPC